MIMFLLTLTTAIAISAVAAYFSIVGLVAIFASAPIAIAIMGSVLELAKLVTASWIYRNWDIAHTTLKWYFTGAVIILSLITSMGIFGYLSKAHIEQTTGAGTTVIQLKVLEQREQILKQRIDFLVKQEGKASEVNNKLNRDLNTAQAELKKVLDEKIPLLQEKNKIDAEVGPIKYITELIYNESDETSINKAVRWVIITLIFVFDPLAILLLIAANVSFNQRKKPVSEFVPFEYTEPKKDWSPEMYERVKQDPNAVSIEKGRIHSIPKEILDKVFRK